MAALIGPHRVERGDFVIDHGGAAYTLMIIGALLLPVAALVLGRTDDRRGVPLRRDLVTAVRGGSVEPVAATADGGFFIVVEGGDGAGKTTQVEKLAEWIRSKGHEVVVTREPGATPVGQRLRTILLDVSTGGLSHRAEALLYAADKAEHVETVVRPALERGAVVISDRYIDSAVAYQGAGRDLSATEVARISRWATDGLLPHLTVLLDVSPETARERFTEAPDRLESEPSEFHQRVRSGFLALAAADPARYLVVDAGQDPESVTTAARHRLDQMLPLSEKELREQEEARRKAEEEARRRAEEERRRKEEEERLERERQEELARLRAEEEERKAREAEEARLAEERRKAEEARRVAEEARRLAEEERRRREAEERLRQAEEERRRREAEEEARLRAQAEERRREVQRKAEEALLAAERARLEKADNSETVQIPQVGDADDGSNSETMQIPNSYPGTADDETTVLPVAGDVGETRPIPKVTDEGGDEEPKRRSRPAWAEETPLDDVPTLADELLGPHRDDDERDEGKGARAAEAAEPTGPAGPLSRPPKRRFRDLRERRFRRVWGCRPLLVAGRGQQRERLVDGDLVAGGDPVRAVADLVGGGHAVAGGGGGHAGVVRAVLLGREGDPAASAGVGGAGVDQGAAFVDDLEDHVLDTVPGARVLGDRDEDPFFRGGPVLFLGRFLGGVLLDRVLLGGRLLGRHQRGAGDGADDHVARQVPGGLGEAEAQGVDGEGAVRAGELFVEDDLAEAAGQLDGGARRRVGAEAEARTAVDGEQDVVDAYPGGRVGLVLAGAARGHHAGAEDGGGQVEFGGGDAGLGGGPAGAALTGAGVDAGDGAEGGEAGGGDLGPDGTAGVGGVGLGDGDAVAEGGGEAGGGETGRVGGGGGERGTGEGEGEGGGHSEGREGCGAGHGAGHSYHRDAMTT